jgi:4-hydroxy-4-methyl-2-oxoglutarate aldolase
VTESSPSVLSRLAASDVATVHEAAGRIGDLDRRIRPIQQDVTVAGRAVTAGVQPGDNLAVHLAILEANPGDVLVVAANGHVAGYWGEIMAVAAQERGIAGLVIDGGCRDTAALRRRGFPVWAAGVSVHGCVKQQRGVVNGQVAAGGIVVNPGDYVLADDDGVVVISAARIEDVLAAAEARTAKEDDIMSGLANGGTTIELMGLAEAAGRG